MTWTFVLLVLAFVLAAIATWRSPKSEIAWAVLIVTLVLLLPALPPLPR